MTEDTCFLCSVPQLWDAGIVFKTNFQTISVADNYNDVCVAVVVVVVLSNDSPDNSSHHSLWVGIFVDHQQDGPDKYKYYMEAQHSDVIIGYQ